jgi:hypothetical protein
MKTKSLSLSLTALMALGGPVVFSACGTEDEVAVDDGTGVDEVSPEQMEEALRNPDILHIGRNGGVHNQARRGGGGGGNGINYYGGPVMVNPNNVYAIWYGNWAAGSQDILRNLMANIGGTPYWAINTTYYNAQNVHVPNQLTFAGEVSDNYSQGNALSDAQIQGIVAAQINAGALPADPDGVYVVLTASDVDETSGFCRSYCGWHTHANIAGTDIKYAFVGNAARCLNACSPQAVGPNGDAGADATASIMAHEMEEAVTDPDLNAWLDGHGYENADKCAWTYGNTHSAPNRAKYNMTIGGRNYLIQRNWKNANGGACVLSYP